ncbi:MAG: GyrI-like domain-containing protein [Janthinobacterium lividum]
MKKTNLSFKDIKLVGTTCRTSNELEFNPLTAKIGQTLEYYFQNGLSEKIVNRKTPGITYCVYTDYESDWTGSYTYFVGEEVTSFSDVSENLSELVIPSQHYTKFTSEAGTMPKVCIEMWQQIWQMTAKDFGSERAYLADFKAYDDRAKDPTNTILDIYIGLKN